MKYYKVTANHGGVRVSVSMPDLTKKQAEHMESELKLNRHFSEVRIEQSAMK